MALKTRKEYLQSLKAMRPNIYKFGELIEDVTTHPATRRTVESHARAFDAAHDPKYAAIFTAKSLQRREDPQVQFHDAEHGRRHRQLQVQAGHVPLHGHLQRGAVRRLERPERAVERDLRHGQGIRHKIPGKI